MADKSIELPDLRVTIDRIVYFCDASKLPSDKPHAFIYYISIRNLTDVTVTLNGRRWIIRYSDGKQNIIEGEGIVGKTPTLTPGEAFTYNSYHVTSQNARAKGSFHGFDSNNRLIHTLIPGFNLIIPTEGSN